MGRSYEYEGFMTKLRALYVTSFIPSEVALQAGQKTSYKYLKELASSHITDVIIINRKSRRGDNTNSLKNIINLNSIHTIEMSKLEWLVSPIVGLFFGIAPRFSSRISLKTVRKVLELKQEEYDIFWLEFSQSFWLAKILSIKKSKLILSSHDIQTQLVSRKSFLEKILFLGLTFNTESDLLRAASLVRVQSLKDKSLICSLYDLKNEKVQVAEPAISEFIHNVKRNKIKTKPYTLLFWGAMGRIENSSAIQDFIKRNWENLKARYPTIKLYIVGSNPPDDLLTINDRSIIVTGFVEDPTEYFELASFGIVPLQKGAGIKVKVLEMLKAGIPVISTSVGAEGIERCDLLEVYPYNKLFDAICQKWG